MGSGHILVYAFDVLMQIYQSAGWDQRDAAQSILTNNLYGLDIDDRAAQLAYFAVMMKARQYDRRILTRGIQPHVYAIAESNHLDKSTLEYFTNNDPQLKNDMGTLVNELRDAKEYGSILNISPVDFAALFTRIDEVQNDISIFRDNVLNDIAPLIQVAAVMAQKYDVAVTNPPYMGSKGMSDKLSDYIKNIYPKAKTDIFACFIEKGFNMIKPHGFNTQVTMQVWMFLTAFDAFRNEVTNSSHIVSLLHMDNMVMGIAFGTSATVFRKGYMPDYLGQYSYATLNDINDEGEPDYFPVVNDRLTVARISDMAKIPRSPIAYWASEANTAGYANNQSLSCFSDVKKGMSTADDERFLRLWTEVSKEKFSIFTSTDTKWYRLNKGGAFRRWYGNNEYVVNWEHNGTELKSFKKSVIRNEQYYLKPRCLTWTYVTNYKLNVRYCENVLFSAVGPCIFQKTLPLEYLLGFLNTKVAQMYADNVGGETITYEVGEVASIPVAQINTDDTNKVVAISEECIQISRCDWDNYEFSWDFKRHPLLPPRENTEDESK